MPPAEQIEQQVEEWTDRLYAAIVAPKVETMREALRPVVRDLLAAGGIRPEGAPGWQGSLANWQPISTAPKRPSYYVLITDGVCVADIAQWVPERPERIVDGNRYLAVPEGWFSVDATRSRISPTHWMPVPPAPSASG